jgi:hypothetical protein
VTAIGSLFAVAMDAEDMTRGRNQTQWPPDEAAVREVLNALSEPAEPGSGGPSLFEAAVLEALTSAGGSVAVGELVEKLAADYDRFPTRAAILRVHFSRTNPHTDGAPSDN